MPPERAAFILLRVLAASLMFVHGAARLLGGGVAPFGTWFAGLGVPAPAGAALAWAVTLFELLAAPLVAMGVLVRWLAPLFALQLLAGIALVHAPEGWFVVGLGRNGAEYSVLLVGCFAALWLLDAAARRAPA
jgi:putative oxidoreductase